VAGASLLNIWFRIIHEEETGTETEPLLFSISGGIDGCSFCFGFGSELVQISS